jgi:transcriptional regulator with XRE-family HTH domain
MYAGKKLKLLRQELDLNQSEMADKLGLSQSYYSAVERGKKKITQKLVKKVEETWNKYKGWFEQNGVQKMGGENGGKMGATLNLYNHGQVSSTKPYDLYNSLSDNELKFEISREIEAMKDSFEDYSKLTEFLHKVNAPKFLKDKFHIGPDFKTYLKEAENEFNEDHSHIKDGKHLKVLKIVDLYQSQRDHFKRQLSSLIHYLHHYADMFNDDPKVNKLQ